MFDLGPENRRGKDSRLRMIGMNNKQGYYALAIALERRCLPEWAWEKLNGEDGEYYKEVRLDNISDVDLNVIRELRREMNLREIADLYGVKRQTIANVLHRFKEAS